MNSLVFYLIDIGDNLSWKRININWVRRLKLLSSFHYFPELDKFKGDRNALKKKISYIYIYIYNIHRKHTTQEPTWLPVRTFPWPSLLIKASKTRLQTKEAVYSRKWPWKKNCKCKFEFSFFKSITEGKEVISLSGLYSSAIFKFTIIASWGGVVYFNPLITRTDTMNI